MSTPYSLAPARDVPATPRAFSLPAMVGAVCALFVLYFLRSGSYPLFDPDEPVYGLVAREMAGGAGWLTPHLNGALWFDKPPMYYWLSALSIAIFGATEFACRLPSALAGAGLVILVYNLAAHDFGRRAGIVSAIVMATCLQQIVLARAAVTDMTLVFFLTAALYGYRCWLSEMIEGAASTRRSTTWALFCGIATGLAMLTKGPVAPLLLSTTFVLHLWWIGRLKCLRSTSAALAVLAVLLVGLPWYIAMYLLHGQAFVQGFLVANNITRFLKAEHAQQTGHWYSIFLNVPILLVFFFPWSLFLPQALVRLWKRYGHRDARLENTAIGPRLLMVWFAVVFIFFSLSKTLLVTYIFPLYPAAAIGVGMLWCEAATQPVVQKGLRYGLWAILLVTGLLGTGLWIVLHKRNDATQTPVLVMGIILLLSCAAALWSLSHAMDSRARDSRAMDSGIDAGETNFHATANPIEPLTSVPRAVTALSTGMLLLVAWLVYQVVPIVAVNESSPSVIRTLPPQAVRIAEVRVRVPSLSFYLRNQPPDRYLGVMQVEQAQQALHQPQPLFLLCRPDTAATLMAGGASEWARVGRMILICNAAAKVLQRKETHAP